MVEYEKPIEEKCLSQFCQIEKVAHPMGLLWNKCEEKVIYTLLPLICGTKQFPLRNDLRFLSQYPQESVNMITFKIIIEDNEDSQMFNETPTSLTYHSWTAIVISLLMVEDVTMTK